MKDVYEIDDIDALRLLEDPIKVEILELCAEPTTATEMARFMGVPRTRLYHHLGRLEDAGLIEVVDTVAKRAMTEKRYQAAARTYRGSAGLLASATPREQADALLGSLCASTKADFSRAMETGSVSLDQRGQTRSVALGRRIMRLSPVRLDELIGRLEALFEEFDDDDDPAAATRPVAALHVVYPSSRKTT